MRQVVSHSSATFHQLHLLLVNLDDASIRVGFAIQSDDKAVAQRAHLEVVANSCHRAALRHDVAEMAHEFEDFLFAHGVGVLLFDASNFTSDAMMHIVGRKLVDVTERVFQRILAGPYACGQFVSLKVIECCIIHFLVSVSSLFLHDNWVLFVMVLYLFWHFAKIDGKFKQNISDNKIKCCKTPNITNKSTCN